MIRFVLAVPALVFVFVFLGSSAALGQTDGPADPAPLLSAIRDLQNRATLALDGTARGKDLSGASQAAGGATFVFAGGGPAAASWEGPFEMLRDVSDVLICSKERLPGFLHLRKDGRAFTRTTFEKETLATDTLVDDVAALLDVSRLTEAVEKSAFTLDETADGARIYEGTLSRKLIPEKSGPMGMPMVSPQVLRIEARFETGPDGALRSMRFEVIRTDPMASLRKQMMGGGGGGGGTVRYETGSGGFGEVSSEPGKADIYELAIAGSPSERARQGLESLRRLVDGSF